jgi:hypothetical protein
MGGLHKALQAFRAREKMSLTSAADIRVAWRACHGLAFVSMDFPVQTPATTSQAKGFATIALASAAGVIVASRMNRPALMLAAGLALSWWRRQANVTTEVPACEEQSMKTADAPSMVIQDVEKSPPHIPDNLPETHSEPAPAGVSIQKSPPSARPPLNAWDDLRAAISPAHGRTNKPAQPFNASAEHAVVMAAQSMHIAPPADVFSTSVQDEISLPVIAEIESRLESGSGDFMLTDDESQNAEPTSTSTDSPEVQSKKTFFDWLRN